MKQFTDSTSIAKFINNKMIKIKCIKYTLYNNKTLNSWNLNYFHSILELHTFLVPNLIYKYIIIIFIKLVKLYSVIKIKHIIIKFK